ncbi:MAG: SET domain-containing protein-lysine N-methyltransferase, partial [Verrucomicrobia bacterium]|nr:SET domain-containing protein-lysine N-methyltransferase [Verrucomicrobiota bacterium]
FMRSSVAKKFKIPTQLIQKDLRELCSVKIKEDKVFVLPATKGLIKGLLPIFREIQKSGLPKNLVIKKLKGKIGFGVFLHPMAKPILKGEPIAPYSGKVVICPQNVENDTAYSFTLLADLHLTREEQKRWDPTRAYHPKRLYTVLVDAYKTGNFTRFINHSEKPNIEAELVRMSKGKGAIPCEIVYVAKKTIRPGEQLLISYEGEDKSYWGTLNIKPFPMTPKTFLLNDASEIVEG